MTTEDLGKIFVLKLITSELIFGRLKSYTLDHATFTIPALVYEPSEPFEEYKEYIDNSSIELSYGHIVYLNAIPEYSSAGTAYRYFEGCSNEG